MEIWQDALGYEGLYQVSSLGRVKSLDREEVLPWGVRKRSGRIMAQKTGKYGHKSVTLYSGGKGRTECVHRLVLTAFGGSCPDGMECRHLNGDPTDNRVENLAWGTHQQNMDDRLAHGRNAFGVKNPRAKLTPEAIREIRASDEPLRECGERFGVRKQTIWSVRRGDIWADVR